jgi:hypothetical protein
MSGRKFVARYAESSADRNKVRLFVDQVYMSTYNTVPPLADVYAVIEKENAIVACMGIEWPEPDGSLALERMYRLKKEELPRKLTIENGMQYGRWASVSPQAGMLAIYAATTYALSKGKRYGLVEHNDDVHRHVARLGIAFWDVNHSLDLSAISELNREYYARGDMKTYLVDLVQIKNVLAKKARKTLSFA